VMDGTDLTVSCTGQSSSGRQFLASNSAGIICYRIPSSHSWGLMANIIELMVLSGGIVLL